MAQVINTNVGALTAQTALLSSRNLLETSINRLSTGLRVNSSKDDAAGLAVAERIMKQVRGLSMDIRNAGDAISRLQVADGGCAQVTANLQRMRELAIQAANEYQSGDRANLDVEFKALSEEIDRIAQSTTFNEQNLLDRGATFTFQVGVTADPFSQITVTSVNLRASMLGITYASTSFALTGTTGSHALQTLSTIDAAIETIVTTRAGFGAAMNRCEAVISFLNLSVLNQQVSRGRIVDADYALESAHLSRATILQNSGMIMLAQANQLPQAVLTLLRG